MTNKYGLKYWAKLSRRRRSHLHPVVREYVEPKIAEIRKIIPINRNTKVMEVGAGSGFF